VIDNLRISGEIDWAGALNVREVVWPPDKGKNGSERQSGRFFCQRDLRSSRETWFYVRGTQSARIVPTPRGKGQILGEGPIMMRARARSASSSLDPLALAGSVPGFF